MGYSYLDEMAGIVDPGEAHGPRESVVVHQQGGVRGHGQLVLGRFWFDSSQIPDDLSIANALVGQGIVHNAYTFTAVCASPASRRKGVGVRVDAVLQLDPPARALFDVIRTRSIRTKAGESIIGGKYKAQPLDPDGAVDMGARAELVVAHQHIAPVTHDWLMGTFEWYRTYCTLVAESRESGS